MRETQRFVEKGVFCGKMGVFMSLWLKMGVFLGKWGFRGFLIKKSGKSRKEPGI